MFEDIKIKIYWTGREHKEVIKNYWQKIHP